MSLWYNNAEVLLECNPIIWYIINKCQINGVSEYRKSSFTNNTESNQISKTTNEAIYSIKSE